MRTNILLCLFAFIILSNAKYFIHQDDGKVKVDIYVQSLCSDTINFILKSLKPAASTKDFWKICDLHLYPYGNAKRERNGTSWAFTCQHGPRQCQGNLIQTCALKKYDFYSRALPFIICMEENTTDWLLTGHKCAYQLNMNWEAINGCANSEEGVQLEADIAEKTEKLNPPHTHVPWVVIDGKYDLSAEQKLIANMVAYVCSIYQGPLKIDACN